MRKLLIFIPLFILATTVDAQKKWSYQLQLGGEVKSGNVNTVTFTNGGGIERNDSILAFDANYAIVYGKKDREVYDKSLLCNLKFDVWQYSRWSPFVLATYYNNKFKGYEYKFSLLGGVKYRFFHNDKCDYSISAAFTQEHVDYFAGTELDHNLSRLSLRFKMRHQVNEVVNIKNTTFYQPSLTAMTDDYIVTSITTLAVKLYKNIHLDLNFNYEFHSLVPETVAKQDIITTANLRIRF